MEINMKNIEMNLKKEGLCKKIEYTGSSYEGLKITEDGLEFDVMFIMDGKDIEIIELEKYPGFASLKIKNGVTHSKLQNFVDLKTRFLLPHQFMENFLKDVKGIVGKFNEGKRMELIRTGPSACLNMFQENEILCSVDLVPAFEIDNQGKLDALIFPMPISLRQWIFKEISASGLAHWKYFKSSFFTEIL